jgi:hypothetical protein
MGDTMVCEKLEFLPTSLYAGRLSVGTVLLLTIHFIGNKNT